jgi:hypothetical protein
MVVPVAVVRAPMIGVSMEGGQPSMLATPWVRLVRLDPGNSPQRQAPTNRRRLMWFTSTLSKSTRGSRSRRLWKQSDASQSSPSPVSGKAVAARWPEAKGDSRDEVDEQADEKPPYYRSMQPAMSDDEFMAGWAERFRRAHSHSSEPAWRTEVHRYPSHRAVR